MIVDAQNDVLLELLIRAGGEQPFELVLRRGRERLFERYWLPRLGAGGVGVQICPFYGVGVPRDEAGDRALAQAAEFGWAVEQNAQRVCQVRSRVELDDPRLRLVLSMQGVEPLEGFTGPEHYPTLVAALQERGYHGEWLEAITSGNWLRILRATLPP